MNCLPLADATPMTDEELDALESVLEDMDKEFGHFEVERADFLKDSSGVYARAVREQANFTVTLNGEPRGHHSVHQREWPVWETDGPRLLATVRELQEQINDADQLGMDIDLLT